MEEGSMGKKYGVKKRKGERVIMKETEVKEVGGIFPRLYTTVKFCNFFLIKYIKVKIYQWFYISFQ